MQSQNTKPVGECRIVGRNHATVSSATQVLGGEEAKATECAQAAHLRTIVARTDGLRGVLDDRQSVLLGRLEYGIEVGWQSEEVYGDNSARPLGDRRLDQTAIKVVALRLDIDEHRSRSHTSYRTRRGYEGKRS